MLNVLMLTEMILWPMPCGTVCVAYKPYFHLIIIEDNQEFYSVVIECVSNYPYQFHEMYGKVFIPFEINESI